MATIDPVTRAQFARHGIRGPLDFPAEWRMPLSDEPLSEDQLVAYLTREEDWSIRVERRRAPLGEIWHIADWQGTAYTYPEMCRHLLAAGWSFVPPRVGHWRWHLLTYSPADLRTELRSKGWRPADPDKPHGALIAPTTPWVDSATADEYLAIDARDGREAAERWLAAQLRAADDRDSYDDAAYTIITTRPTGNATA